MTIEEQQSDFISVMVPAKLATQVNLAIQGGENNTLIDDSITAALLEWQEEEASPVGAEPCCLCGKEGHSSFDHEGNVWWLCEHHATMMFRAVRAAAKAQGSIKPPIQPPARIIDCGEEPATGFAAEIEKSRQALRQAWEQGKGGDVS